MMEDFCGSSSRSRIEMVASTQGIEDVSYGYEDDGGNDDCGGEEYNDEGVNDEYDGEEDVDEFVENEHRAEENIEGAVLNAEDEEENVDNCEDDDIDSEDGASSKEGLLFSIDSIDDIGNLDLVNFGAAEVLNLDFVNVEVALLFYSLYAKVKGFVVRKSKMVRSKKGDVVQQAFVCNREGYREDRCISNEQRKRKAKVETRCGCKAQLRVHVDKESMRWYVNYFNDEHNHDMVAAKYAGMLPGYRKMSDLDVVEMNYFRNAGIPPYLMYGSFAWQSGGYENIGFTQKDIYNQIGKQRRKNEPDAKAYLNYLFGLGESDKKIFVSHTVDGEGRMQHLFWSDGTSQDDYKVFGDVLAFDATYGRNKYRCPVVVFSGVNHHRQTIVFGAAVIANETEETYVWLLNEFLKAMKGKAPSAVVTDGDAAMRNAIKVVFPKAHHRLCAWHLSRNASSNVGIPAFTSEFTLCMLGDLDIGQFNKRWSDMVEKFGLQDNGWVAQMYEKRKMWAVAYMRGRFFGGLRTTSRAEGLHAQLGRYVKSRYNLTEFVQHFNRCVMHMRFKEHEADFASHYGEPMLETDFHSLERSGSLVYTRAVFDIFRGVLLKSASMAVVGCKEASCHNIYVVVKNGGSGKQRFMSFYASTFQLKCACMKMESIGILCEHIVAVLIHLNIEKLPRSLVLDRWTKFAKDSLKDMTGGGSNSLPAQFICRYAVLMQQYREMAVLACKNFEVFCVEREKARISIEDLRLKVGSIELNESYVGGFVEAGIRDPAQVASRGKGVSAASSSQLRSKRKTRCSFCKLYGHNKKSCKGHRNYVGTMESQFGSFLPWAEDETSFNNEDYHDQFAEFRVSRGSFES